MKGKKLAALGIVFAVAFAAFLTGSNGAEARSGNELSMLLPASDAAIVLDSKRLINDALPQILSSNQPMLEHINGEIENIKNQTGLDLTKFDSVAVGLKNKSANSNQFDPVLLARGTASTDSLEAVARTASGGSYTTEIAGSRKIFVFSPKKLVDEKNSAKIKGSFAGGMFDSIFSGLTEEVALTAYDSNTVAFGSLARVKETIGNTPRISIDLLTLLERKPDSLANMGMLLPTGVSRFLPLEDDELGASLDSIRQMQGSLDINDGTTALSIAAKTADPTEAENLAMTLEGMSNMLADILEGNASADKQAYSRMLRNLEVSYSDRDIFVELLVPKSDIDIVIGK